MIQTRWKLGAAIAALALGIWLVPVALSSFTANTTFTTSTPVTTNANPGDRLVIEDTRFVNISDQGPFGSTSPGNYRLSMDGTVYATGGLNNSVTNYRGAYNIVYSDGLVDTTVSQGGFEMQAASGIASNHVLLNASLMEQSGNGNGLAFGNSTFTALSHDGRSFEGLFNASGISSDHVPGGGDLGELPILDGMCEILCGCDHGKGNGETPDGGAPGVVVPEPGSFALLTLVGGATALVRRRRPSRD